MTAHWGRARGVPKTEATDWLRSNRLNRTLRSDTEGFVLPSNYFGEAPEGRSWVKNAKSAGPVLPGFPYWHSSALAATLLRSGSTKVL